MAYRNNVGAATSSVEAELAASHKRARQLLNAIEFQLQQLEQEAMYARPAAATTAGLHARAQDMRLEEETVESRRSALSDSLNRLMAETSEFDRAVNSAFPAIGAGAPGRDIWRRCVRFVTPTPCDAQHARLSFCEGCTRVRCSLRGAARACVAVRPLGLTQRTRF
ncbi:MAG: hypothetical protein EOO65_03575 [Methanosarcinales archaeon]|nr:MAG: hypothetical protein EOO65_03575 [Methanosarcinales archaeon]